MSKERTLIDMDRKPRNGFAERYEVGILNPDEVICFVSTKSEALYIVSRLVSSEKPYVFDRMARRGHPDTWNQTGAVTHVKARLIVGRRV